VLWLTAREWFEDDAVNWGAATAFYTLFSLGPLVLLGTTILESFVGTEAARRQILDQASLLLGPRGADVTRAVVESAGRIQLGSVGTIVSAVLLFFGATAVFVTFQKALNRIWEVRSVQNPLHAMLRQRMAAFLMVLCLGGLMVASLIVGTVLGWADAAVSPFTSNVPLLQLLDTVSSLILTWLFVGAAYWLLPDVEISWKDVWGGALVTAVLLVVGKSVLSIFLAHHAIAASFSGAGSLFLLLLWVYYSAQVFYFGAEFTWIWAKEEGRTIRPDETAEPIS